MPGFAVYIWKTVHSDNKHIISWHMSCDYVSCIYIAGIKHKKVSMTVSKIYQNNVGKLFEKNY